jgi:hypothetical protein
MRYGTRLALLIVLAFCVFGFVATFEPMAATKQWTWRVVYGVIAVACLGAFAWAAPPRK